MTISVLHKEMEDLRSKWTLNPEKRWLSISKTLDLTTRQNFAKTGCKTTRVNSKETVRTPMVMKRSIIDLMFIKITRQKCVKNGMKQHLDNASMAKSVNSSTMKTQLPKPNQLFNSLHFLLLLMINTSQII